MLTQVINSFNGKEMKKILITGATGGIGKVLSVYLARAGFEVILFARNQEKLKLLSEQISAFGLRVPKTYSLDLGNVNEIDLFQFEQLGSIDGLVLMPPQLAPAADPFASPDQWKSYFNTSFIGPLHFFKLLMPLLKQSVRAKVVLISGISSLQVLSHYATSNVLRCAWVAQAKTLAHHLGPESIHVNTLSLGGVLTEDYVSELELEARQAQLRLEEVIGRETANVPLRKYASPLEVAYAVHGLLSNFSNHMTGINIALDGGFTKSY